MSVFNFFPEGWKNEKIESTNGILQGFVTNCDKDFNLHVELENGEKGIIPREEVEAINVDENGIPSAKPTTLYSNGCEKIVGDLYIE